MGRNALKSFNKKPATRRSLGGPSHRLTGNINMDIVGMFVNVEVLMILFSIGITR